MNAEATFSGRVLAAVFEGRTIPCGRWAEHPLWTSDAAEDRARAAQTSAQTDGLGDRMAELVAYVNHHPEGVRTDEVQAALHLTRDDAGRYLRRACDAGRIERPKRGLYAPVRSVRSVRNLFAVPDETDTPDTSDTPLDEGDQ